MKFLLNPPTHVEQAIHLMCVWHVLGMILHKAKLCFGYCWRCVRNTNAQAFNDQLAEVPRPGE